LSLLLLSLVPLLSLWRRVPRLLRQQPPQLVLAAVAMLLL
jgi:hypothetical protein